MYEKYTLYSSQSAKREKDLMHVVENKRMKRRAEALTLTQECHQWYRQSHLSERHRSYRPSTETNATSQP